MRLENGSAAGVFLRHEILHLAAAGAVSGVGSKHGHLRYVKALISIRGIHRMIRNVSRGGVSICAEDNYTVSFRPGANGGTYSHNLSRSYAYAHAR